MVRQSTLPKGLKVRKGKHTVVVPARVIEIRKLYEKEDLVDPKGGTLKQWEWVTLLADRWIRVAKELGVVEGDVGIRRLGKESFGGDFTGLDTSITENHYETIQKTINSIILGESAPLLDAEIEIIKAGSKIVGLDRSSNELALFFPLVSEIIAERLKQKPQQFYNHVTTVSGIPTGYSGSYFHNPSTSLMIPTASYKSWSSIGT